MSKYLIYLLNFTVGSIIGSHLLVIVQRFEKENFISAKSHCDSCKIPLTLINQIPIFSFIKYRGKCFFCQTPISPETLYYEIIGGFAFLPLDPYHDLTSYFLITFIFLLSIFDYLEQSFPIYPLIPLFVLTILKMMGNAPNYAEFEWFLILIVLSIFLIMNLRKKFGYGDTIIFIILMFYYNFYLAEYLFLLSSIFLILIYIFDRDKHSYPFIPFIFLSIIFYNYV